MIYTSKVKLGKAPKQEAKVVSACCVDGTEIPLKDEDYTHNPFFSA